MKRFLHVAVPFIFITLVYGCAGMAASAEEYYSIGMAYFEMGKYEEAEAWLNRAKAAEKTMVASQYNLGRLAFERQRYHEAAGYFEDILKKDPNNTLALRAAAYARIYTGDMDIAQRHYSRLLELIPESADDGYNHALVLYAMGRYSNAEEVLEKYRFSLQDNSEIMLLYARSQNAQNKVEAINGYSSWLNTNKDANVRYEYAQALEKHELYARALEEYRMAIFETSASDGDLRKNIRFALAKLLLIADSESNEGITELQTAINEGFNDIAAVEELLTLKISDAHISSIRENIDNMRQAGTQD